MKIKEKSTTSRPRSGPHGHPGRPHRGRVHRRERPALQKVPAPLPGLRQGLRVLRHGQPRRAQAVEGDGPGALILLPGVRALQGALPRARRAHRGRPLGAAQLALHARLRGLRPGHGRLERPVEVRERLGVREARRPHPLREQPPLPSQHLRGRHLRHGRHEVDLALADQPHVVRQGHRHLVEPQRCEVSLGPQVGLEAGVGLRLDGGVEGDVVLAAVVGEGVVPGEAVQCH